MSNSINYFGSMVLVLLAITLFTLGSCKKKDDQASTFECARSNSLLDSIGVAKALFGNRFVFSYRNCSRAGEVNNINSSMTVTFTWNGSNGVYEVWSKINKDEKTDRGTFELKKAEDGNWQIISTPACIYIEGRIKSCRNSVLFENAQNDGCDNLYDKI